MVFVIVQVEGFAQIKLLCAVLVHNSSVLTHGEKQGWDFSPSGIWHWGKGQRGPGVCTSGDSTGMSGSGPAEAWLTDLLASATTTIPWGQPLHPAFISVCIVPLCAHHPHHSLRPSIPFSVSLPSCHVVAGWLRHHGNAVVMMSREHRRSAKRGLSYCHMVYRLQLWLMVIGEGSLSINAI